MRWHILGAGAVGCTWAVNLLNSNIDVTLILSNENRLNEYQASNGIFYTGLDHKTCHVHPDAELAKNPSEITHLLITTKAYSTLPALTQIKHRLTHKTHIVLLQNGMGQHEEVHKLLPNCPLWAATTTDGAYKKSQFHVIRAGQGETLIGAISTSETALLFPATLGELNIQQVPDIEHYLWRKVAINAAINPLTALLDCKNGELITQPEYHQLLVPLCKEIESIINLLNLPLFTKPLIDVVTEIATNTSNNYSSMHQDLANKRPTEIAYINGYIQLQARKNGIPCPINDQLIADIKSRDIH